VKATGGYHSFGNVIPSDHQAIWLDLHLSEICPLHQEGHIKPWACRLQCKDPRVVACYNNTLLDILKQKSLQQQINQLNAKLLKPMDLWHSHCKELNTLNLQTFGTVFAKNSTPLVMWSQMQNTEQKISIKS